MKELGIEKKPKRFVGQGCQMCSHLHRFYLHVNDFFFALTNVTSGLQLNHSRGHEDAQVPRNGPLGKVENEKVLPGFLKKEELGEKSY